MSEKKKYEYGAVMMNVPFPSLGLHSYIHSSHVYNGDSTGGLETKPHVTLLYGLHKEVPLLNVLKIMDGFTFGQVTINGISKFESELYDVLKFNVKCDNIAECNKKLQKLPHTNSFKEYIPHLTLGYLKKGYVDYYIKMFDKYNVTTYPSSATYSTSTGDIFKIPIKINLK